MVEIEKPMAELRTEDPEAELGDSAGTDQDGQVTSARLQRTSMRRR